MSICIFIKTQSAFSQVLVATLSKTKFVVMELSGKFIHYSSCYGSRGGYKCYVSSALITQPLTEIKAINGDNWRGNDALQALSISGTVNYVPRGLNLIFPNLARLSIYVGELKEISREDFIGLEKLEEVNFCSNDLTSLPDDLFVNMPNLRWIKFERNKIEKMTSKLLEPIMNNKLQTVSFIGNKKIDAFFQIKTGRRGNSIFTERSVNTIEDLMQIIDDQCHEPTIAEIYGKEVKSEESKQKLFMMHQVNSTEGFHKLLLTGEFSDFSIITRGSTKFQVHKCILAAHSAVFSEIFRNDANATEMKIEDSNAESVEELLRYLYTGKLTSDAKTVMHIFALAKQFKVFEVQEIAEKMILSTMNNLNAYEIFTFGHSHKSEKIKKEAFEEIRKIFPDKNFADSLVDDVQAVKEKIDEQL